MRFFKNTLGPLWLIFIISWYLKYRLYYESSLTYWKEAMALLVILGIFGALIVGIQALGGGKKLKITPLRILLTAILGTTLIGGLLYHTTDPAIFSEPYRIYFFQDGSFAMVDETDQNYDPGFPASIKRGAVLYEADKGLAQLPEQVQAMFHKLSWGEFVWNLLLEVTKNMAIMGLFVVFFYNLGALLLRVKTNLLSPMMFFEAVGVGMGGTMAILFMVGAFGGFSPGVVQTVMGALFLLGLIKVKPLWNAAYATEWSIPWKQLKTIGPLALFLLLFFSLNFIDVLAPVPIGHDAIKIYQNLPNLMTQYGGLVPGFNSYNIELILSLAYLVFKSATVGFLVVFLGGLLAMLLLHQLLKKIMDPAHALLLLALFASLPMINFLMHIDLKIDMPLLFFSLLAVHSVAHQRVLKTGLFLGIAFGIKYTSIILIATVFGIYAYTLSGIAGAMGMFFLTVGGLGMMKNLPPIQEWSNTVQNVISLAFLAVGLVILVHQWIQKKMSWKTLKPFGWIALIILLVFSPWMIKNGLETKSIGSRALLFGKSNAVQIDASGWNIDEKACTTSRYTEVVLGSYVGGEKGLATLPRILWESTIHSKTINDRISDISFLFLGFAVFFAIAWRELKKEKPILKPIAGFTLFYGVLWWISSNGIVWYGLPMLLGLLILYIEAWKKERWPYFVLGIWLLMSFFLRYADSYLENTTLLYAGKAEDRATYINQRGEQYVEISALINSKPEKNVYFMGSFLIYYIAKNDARIYEDITLDHFHCYFQADNPEETLRRLQEANFGFVVFTTNGLLAEPSGFGPIHDQIAWADQFAAEYLIPRYKTNELILYEVPE